MKNLILSLVVLGLPALSQASGFSCQTIEGDLSVLIHNYAHPEKGTRKGAMMVLTDSLSQEETRTLIRFYGDTKHLQNKGAHYVGIVYKSYHDGSWGGRVESVLGNPLTELLRIEADIDFSYSAPVANGEEVSGSLVLVRVDGDEVVRDLSCKRILKN
jgi:hypothetical protein